MHKVNWNIQMSLSISRASGRRPPPARHSSPVVLTPADEILYILLDICRAYAPIADTHSIHYIYYCHCFALIEVTGVLQVPNAPTLYPTFFSSVYDAYLSPLLSPSLDPLQMSFLAPTVSGSTVSPLAARARRFTL